MVKIRKGQNRTYEIQEQHHIFTLAVGDINVNANVE